MHPFRFRTDTNRIFTGPARTSVRPSNSPLPWQDRTNAKDESQRRLDVMERDEPKRRLIRDAKALAKIRKITQAQMAEEMGVPHRTLEEWLQFRRMPKSPGTTLIRRWVDTHRSKTTG
ncbi:helix-turn-helix domain-containing protein [Billgrantia antri]|uniref:Helix-turn-helix domain-containing protein n=1 Tax=Billgrantia antri TaxID=2846777 RepID=A0ABS6ZJG8_9GAMM|nr:helix-turn-helix transcriptional regulator [Halomonas antri]MBW6390201.1 helix-turn-helix domain-containing protein [Halomonas antri]